METSSTSRSPITRPSTKISIWAIARMPGPSTLPLSNADGRTWDTRISTTRDNFSLTTPIMRNEPQIQSSDEDRKAGDSGSGSCQAHAELVVGQPFHVSVESSKRTSIVSSSTNVESLATSSMTSARSSLPTTRALAYSLPGTGGPNGDLAEFVAAVEDHLDQCNSDDADEEHAGKDEETLGPALRQNFAFGDCPDHRWTLWPGARTFWRTDGRCDPMR